MSQWYPASGDMYSKYRILFVLTGYELRLRYRIGGVKFSEITPISIIQLIY